MLTNMYLRESKGEKMVGYGKRSHICLRLATIARTVKFTYATRVDGGGQPYPASRDATAPFFFLAYWPPILPSSSKASKGKRLVVDTQGDIR